MPTCQSIFLVWLILAGIGSLVNVQAQVRCPTDYTESTETGTCIRLFLNYDIPEWSITRSMCQAQGGDLVKIVNSQMNDQIYELMAEQSEAILALMYPFVWIGLHYIEEDTTWVWLDETTATEWTNWKPGEPEMTFSQYCGALDFTENGEWLDLQCDRTDTLPYICELPSIASSTISASTTEEFTSTRITTEPAFTTEELASSPTEVTKETTKIGESSTELTQAANESDATTQPSVTPTVGLSTQPATTGNAFSTAQTDALTSTADPTTEEVTSGSVSITLMAILLGVSLIFGLLSTVTAWHCGKRQGLKWIRREQKNDNRIFTNTVYDGM